MEGQFREYKPWGRAPFLLLSWVAFLIAASVIVAFLFLSYPKLVSISKSLTIAVCLVGVLVILSVGGGLLLITVTAITGIDLLYPHGKTQITMRVLPPIIYSIGKLFLGIDTDRLMESVVAVTNALFIAQAKRGRFDFSRVLILLPHCIQWHSCPWKITWSIENCKRCGKCPTSDLISLHKWDGFSIYVATGGTIARRVISEAKPTVVLAVACPRDLSEGMVDVYPIPVYGILLLRPHGPCFDTFLEMEKVEKFLENFRYDAFERVAKVREEARISMKREEFERERNEPVNR